MAARTIGIINAVDKRGSGPGDVICGCRDVTVCAVLSARWDMVRILGGPIGALGTLRCV